MAQRLYERARTPGRHRQIALAVVVVAMAGLTTWALWPEPPRQREYLDATACLLTDEQGVSAEPAQTVWKSMEDASTATLVQAQYLKVYGTSSVDNATPYLNSLAMSRCGTIIATGQAQIDAVTGKAGDHPDIDFITIDGGSPGGNVRRLDTSAAPALRTEIQKQFEELADSAP
ncbi:hypothetical protein Aca07nite_52150 [Actinoplanes capillaceus]|uniref:Uncharacterized protein n=1 Tax=Actinoplanes campanulatus TaxID=113559 RepID=A0ABQ3WP34_9ACTN|nr:hypothetical protein [Actinoplanes capillaceus]GID47940.1 hypothetical protein Aca07nite_52150 [Actinoplanes capillaceus]